jgi:WXG100 family type VII secretion target
MIDTIQANYDDLETQANRFNNQSQAIKAMLQKVRNSLQDLEQGGWIGRGSDAFFAEMHGELLPASERLEQALEEASRVARQISHTIQQAEEEASSPFKSMT